MGLTTNEGRNMFGPLPFRFFRPSQTSIYKSEVDDLGRRLKVVNLNVYAFITFSTY